MTRQVPFTAHEAVLLLEAFLKAYSNQVSEDNAIKNCSEALRRMAVVNKLEIDDKYRSVTGITFQIKRMESAFYGKNMGLAATKLFTKTVFMYHDERQRYDGLLDEAHLMSSVGNRNRALFVAWISQKILPTMFPRLYSAYGEIEKIARGKEIIHCSLFDVLSLDTLYKIKEVILLSLEIQTLYEDQLSIMILSLEYLIRYTAEEISSSGPKDQSPGKDTIEGSAETHSEESSHPGFTALSEGSETNSPMAEKEPDFVRCREASENTKSATEPSRQVETGFLEERDQGYTKSDPRKKNASSPRDRFNFHLLPRLAFTMP